VTSGLLKFMDDTTVFGVVASQKDIHKLQNELKNVCRWSKEWLMLLNVDKCKVRHIGYNNKKGKLEKEGKILEEKG
jgi:hypothetical protein